MELEGKVALVTGAGRGIGPTIALALAREGADVVINYRNSREGAEKVADEITAMGRSALVVRADVGNRAEVEGMVSAALGAMGRIDILINNAAAKRRMLVADTSEELWDAIIDTNLKGTFLCSQAVLNDMMARKSGKIVSITSGRGIVGQAKGAHYAASKAGIIAFTKSLALEVFPYGINVNAVAPGRVNTDQWREGRSKEQIEEMLAIPRLHPNGVGRVEDIVGTILYLVTDASKYVTGQTIVMQTPNPGAEPPG